eukprot:6350626-Pyramimonas_sp.AAC.1
MCRSDAEGGSQGLAHLHVGDAAREPGALDIGVGLALLADHELALPVLHLRFVSLDGPGGSDRVQDQGGERRAVDLEHGFGERGEEEFRRHGLAGGREDVLHEGLWQHAPPGIAASAIIPGTWRQS